MEWLEVQRSQLFHECHPRKSQTAIDGKTLRGQCGRPDGPQQAVFLLRQRVGSDCASDRHTHDRADRCASKPCSSTAFVRPQELCRSHYLPRRAAGGPVLSKYVFPLQKRERDAARRAWLSLQCRRQPDNRQTTAWGRLRESPERLAFKRLS